MNMLEIENNWKSISYTFTSEVKKSMGNINSKKVKKKKTNKESITANFNEIESKHIIKRINDINYLRRFIKLACL